MSKEPEENILMITARADFGGGPQHLFLLLKYLKDQLSIFIACPDDFPYRKRYENLAGVEHIFLIPHRKFKIKYLFRLKRFIQNKNIKIIHSHGKGAGIYGRLLSLLTGRPSVHTFHGLHIDNYNFFVKIIYKIIEKLLSFFTKKFICVSESECNRITAAKIAPFHKIEVINNGVEKPGTVEKIPADSIKKILHITRFDFAKNSLLLIPILESLKNREQNFKLTVIGSGEEEQEFKESIKKKNLEELVELKGSAEDLTGYYKESYCLISTSKWEGLPLSVMEAMSYGIPAVASDVPGNRDLIEHNTTGFLYDIRNPEKAAEYLSILLGNSDLWKSFSSASISKIMKDFTAERMARETRNLYREILMILTLMSIFLF